MKQLILFVAIAITVASCFSDDSQGTKEIINMPPADSSAFMNVGVSPAKTKAPDKHIKPKFQPQKSLKIVDSTLGNYASDSLPVKHEEKK